MTFTRLALAPLAALTLAGCFSPRSGEFYQETKAARIESWWAISKAERDFTYYSILTVPLKVLLQGIDIALVNPLVDTVMLPVDAVYPRHSRLIRVVDETGKPVKDAAVIVDGRYHAAGGTDYTLSTEGRDVAVTDKDGYARISRLHGDYALFDCKIAAKDHHARRYVIHANPEAFTPEKVADGREAVVFELARVREPLTSPVRSFDVPLAMTVGEQEWVRSYDLAKGQWLPPFGKGEVADVAFAFTGSKEKGTQKLVMRPAESTAAFARLPVKGSCDPRYFVIDYTLPETAAFETEVCLRLSGEDVTHPNVLDAAKEYVAYRVRRADGVHVGALVPSGIGHLMRNVYNPTPGSLTLEYK